MGRGKRQARASVVNAAPAGQPRRRALRKAFYNLPPWDREQWATERKVTENSIRDEDGLLGFVATYGLERDFSNAAAKGVTAVVSGTSFDNAMGTRLWGDDQQEHSAYLLVDGQPICEMNLATLCGWASKDHRGSKNKASFATRDGSFSYWSMTDSEDLAAFADERKLRLDWHAPDEQEIGVRIEGKSLDRSHGALTVLFCQLKEHPTRSIEVPGDAVAAARLVDLLAWAIGGKTPAVKIEAAGPRLRPSALANRIS